MSSQNKPHLRLIAGTTTQKPRLIDNTSSATYVATGVFDADGNPVFKSGQMGPPSSGSGGGGGGSGVKPLWSLDVERDVQIAKWGFAVLATAFASAFLYFNSEFKEVRKDIAAVGASVSAQTATINGVQATLGRVETKLDGEERSRASAEQQAAGSASKKPN